MFVGAATGLGDDIALLDPGDGGANSFSAGAALLGWA